MNNDHRGSFIKNTNTKDKEKDSYLITLIFVKY